MTDRHRFMDSENILLGQTGCLAIRIVGYGVVCFIVAGRFVLLLQVGLFYTKTAAKILQKLHICKWKEIFFAKSGVCTTFLGCNAFANSEQHKIRG